MQLPVRIIPVGLWFWSHLPYQPFLEIAKAKTESRRWLEFPRMPKGVTNPPFLPLTTTPPFATFWQLQSVFFVVGKHTIAHSNIFQNNQQKDEYVCSQDWDNCCLKGRFKNCKNNALLFIKKILQTVRKGWLLSSSPEVWLVRLLE